MPREKKDEDPWHDMESEVDVAMRALLNAREQYRQAADKAGNKEGQKDWTHVSPSAANQIDTLLSALANQINAVEPDVRMMEESVAAALEHPEKYEVPTAELQRRQDVVQNHVRKLGKAKSDVAHGMKLRERRLAVAKGNPGGGAVVASAEVNGFMQQEHATQAELTAQHEKALERIDAGVKSAEMKAKMIGQEMDDQEKTMVDIEHGMTGVQMKIDNSMQRIGVLLDKTSDRGKIIIIVVLMIVLALLVIFLFSGNDSTTASS